MTAVEMSRDDWIKIHEALGDSRWDFRTIGGISRQTGLDRDRVRQLLDQHRSEVRRTLSRNDDAIYTLRSRPIKIREVIADIQRFASNSL